MRRAIQSTLGLVAGTLFGLTGCEPAPTSTLPLRTTQAGSLALDPASGTLFVADEFNGGLAIVDPNAASGHIAFVPTGTRPERVIQRGGNVFVSNRQSRTVTQVDAASHAVVRQFGTGAEPMGLDVSDDGSTLYVACAMSGTVMAFDIASGESTWTSIIGEEVRAVAVIPGGNLYVPGYKSGVMHRLEPAAGVEQNNFGFAVATRLPTGVEHVLSGAGSLVYLTHSVALTATLGPVITQYYVNTSNFSVLPAYTSLDPTFDGTTSASALNPLPSAGSPLAGPKASVADITGQFLFTVNYLSNNVSIQPLTQDAESNGIVQAVATGRGPDGLAVSNDGKWLYVYNSFDHTVSVLSNGGSGNVSIARTIANVMPQPLPDQVWRGMVTFHDASNPNMTNTTTSGVSCASCHPNGREDGNTWQFAEGARNTPSLVGRQIQNTAPYHWDGAMADLPAINEVVQVRMGGLGLGQSDWDDILAYLSSEPAPDNPNAAQGGVLTTQQLEGKTLFQGTAGCTACHTGSALTDNAFHDVGTQFTTISLDELMLNQGAPAVALPNTPSLLGVFASAPYLHDGTAATLEDRIRDNPDGTHGNTASLTDGQVSALAAYLRTL